MVMVSLHFLVVADLEGVVFEGVEFGQLDIHHFLQIRYKVIYTGLSR